MNAKTIVVAKPSRRIESSVARILAQRIEMIPVGELKPWNRNARKHPKKQVQQIANSIASFGFADPVLIDEDRHILGGHGRLAAAELLGMQEIPCVTLANLSEAQKRSFVIATNKIALNAEWDEEVLALELQGILTLDEAFDLTITGFSIAEADQLIEGLAVEESGNPADDALPAETDGPTVTRPGDLWILGHHRLLCGDARNPEDHATLMGHELAQLVIADPPYNVPISGHVSGLGRTRHREFAMASGEMSEDQFTVFLTTVFKNLASVSADGSIHFIFMDWRHLGETLDAGNSAYDSLKNLIVWNKTNAGMGTFYRSQHELIFAFKSGTAPHINSFELGQSGRYRTNLWTYRGMNAFGAGRQQDLALHPTVKPVALLADAMKDVSKRGAVVLDPFGGSGSTLIAAHKTGRRGYLLEIDPAYCDRIIRRWQAMAKEDATLLSTGDSFEAVTKARFGAVENG